MDNDAIKVVPTVGQVEQRFRELKNGAVYDMREKRIVQSPPKHLQSINQENASALSKKRWDAYRERAEIGAAKGSKKDSSLDAWEWITEKQTILAGQIERGRDSTNAAKFVQSALELTQNQENQGNQGVTIQISGDVAAKLLDILSGNV